MPETTPLIKAALNLRGGAGFDVYEKTGLQGAYPPGPLCAAKISNYPTGISDFFTLIKTHRRKRHIKNFLFKKEREGLSNGKKRKTK